MISPTDARWTLYFQKEYEEIGHLYDFLFDADRSTKSVVDYRNYSTIQQMINYINVVEPG